ncbi:hypothetical protein SLA2020_244660 [Shorea laevis]
MAVLSMDSLPLGFRFRPTDEELINHYLRLKINGRGSEVPVIREVDICRCEPWDLPGRSVIKTDDSEWFFFCPRDRKYPNGRRSNRATDAGYWKATGKDRTIKSKKSLIGMKKTLVFYRGRAPNGQRTNWIMHEYQATSKDLDGTAPGQGAFVLCRLFHKVDQKIDSVRYDEVDQTGDSPTTNKSSPDDTSSDLVQETATPELQPQKQSEGIKRWLTDKCDDVSHNGHVIGGSCCNSHMTSDVEDHAEDNAIEGFPHLEENSNFYDLMYNQIDYEVSLPVHSHVHEDLAPDVDSLYASDFGNEHNGICFQDGTAEQDVPLSDLLYEVFNNHEESCEESTSQKNSVSGSEVYNSGNASIPPTLPPESSYVKDNGICSDTDTEMVQVQYGTEIGSSRWFNEQVDKTEYLQMPDSFGSGHPQAALCDREFKSGYVGDFANYSFGQNISPDSAMASFSGSVHGLEEPSSLNNPVNGSGVLLGGPGIRIRTRQPQHQPNSVNFVTQGTAPRRIRLQMRLSPGSFDNDKETNAGLYEEEEVQSALSKATEVEDTGEPEKENQLLNLDENKGTGEGSSIKLRKRVKSDSEPKSTKVDQAAVQQTAPMRHGSSSSFSLMLGIFSILVLFVFVLGIWRCLSS